MNNNDWQTIQTAIKNRLINGAEISLPPMTENHKGAFLACFHPSGILLGEGKKLSEHLEEVVKKQLNVKKIELRKSSESKIEFDTSITSHL